MQQCCPSVLGGLSPLGGEELWPKPTYALRQVSVSLLRFCWQEGPVRPWRSPIHVVYTPVARVSMIVPIRGAGRTRATTTSPAPSAVARDPAPSPTARRRKSDRVASRALPISGPAPITPPSPGERQSRRR